MNNKISIPLIDPPIALVSELTYRCNLSCSYCHNPVDKDLFSDELKTNEWKEIISEANEWGINRIIFTGGEPTLRDDLAELISYAKEKDLDVKLITNAVQLNPTQIESYSKIGLDSVQIGTGLFSKNLSSKTEYNSFISRINTAKLFKSFGIPVSFNVVITRQNANLVEDTLEELYKLDLDNVVLQWVFLFGKAIKNIKDGLKIVPTKDQMNNILDIIARYNSKGIKISTPTFDYLDEYPRLCRWGYTIVVISPNGLILPCESASSLYPEINFPKWESGNSSISRHWDHHKLFYDIRAMLDLPKICKDCSLLNNCRGGCHVYAYFFNQGIFNEDPVCKFSEEHNSFLKLLQ